MKVSKLGNLILFGLIFVIPAVGCKKKPGFLTPLPGARSGQVAEAGSAPPLGPGEKTDVSGLTTGIKSNEPGSHQGWNENAELLKADTVHFDFDSSVVKSGEKPDAPTITGPLRLHATLQRGQTIGWAAGLFVDWLFSESKQAPRAAPEPRRETIERIVRGGFPEPVQRSSEARRRAWFQSYVSSIIQRLR